MAVQASTNTKTDQAGTDRDVAQSVFARTIDEIKAKKVNVEERLEHLKTAGENASKELRAGLEMAWKWPGMT